MDFKDVIMLLHPTIAVIVVFPLIGIVVNYSLQVRQRRLQVLTEGKSKIPPAGLQHVQIGRWLTGAVVGIVLLVLLISIVYNILDEHIWDKNPFKVILLSTGFIATIASFVLLYLARVRLWRGIFATLTGIGLIVLGCQDGVYRSTEKWYISHYYYGITAALLMTFALAILQDIYQDKTNRWRTVHIILSCMAMLTFLVLGFTGAEELLEISLDWQEPYIDKLYQQQCDKKPCTIQAPSIPQ